MKVLNIMLCRKLGGIQQVFCDYDLALRIQKINTLNLIHPYAKIKKQLASQKAKYKTLFNLNQYDPLAIIRLRALIKQFAPDIIIVHGNRAATLTRKAINNNVPIVAVCHNKKVKRLIGCNALFIILEALRKNVLEMGQAPKTSYYIPNMIKLEPNITFQNNKYHKIPVIGTLGRLVEEKALDVLIDALALLKQQNIPFKMLIPGTGKLEIKLKIQVQNHNLEKEVEFIGWIDDKDKFFSEIDIFCLPSRVEHFSIALLEAMKYSKPIVTADSTGPKEVIKHGVDGLVVPRESHTELAASLKTFIQDEKLAKQCAQKAFTKLKNNFTLDITAERIKSALNEIWLCNKEATRQNDTISKT